MKKLLLSDPMIFVISYNLQTIQVPASMLKRAALDSLYKLSKMTMLFWKQVSQHEMSLQTQQHPLP